MNTELLKAFVTSKVHSIEQLAVEGHISLAAFKDFQPCALMLHSASFSSNKLWKIHGDFHSKALTQIYLPWTCLYVSLFQSQNVCCFSTTLQNTGPHSRPHTTKWDKCNSVLRMLWQNINVFTSRPLHNFAEKHCFFKVLIHYNKLQMSKCERHCEEHLMVFQFFSFFYPCWCFCF